MGQPPIRTRPDGTRYPLSGKKKGGTALAAIALAGGIATAGGTFGGAGLSGTVADSVTGALRAKVSNSKSAARKGQQEKAWTRLGLKSVRSATKQALTCAANSYGEVQEFFLRTPCRSLNRMLSPLADGNGNTIVLSVAWVRMRSSSAADRLRDLADTDGTGNVAPLGGIGPRVGDVRFTGKHYDSTRRRSLTVIAEAATGSGSPDAALMDAVTEVAVEFPLPRSKQRRDTRAR